MAAKRKRKTKKRDHAEDDSSLPSDFESEDGSNPSRTASTSIPVQDKDDSYEEEPDNEARSESNKSKCLNPSLLGIEGVLLPVCQLSRPLTILGGELERLHLLDTAATTIDPLTDEDIEPRKAYRFFKLFLRDTTDTSSPDPPRINETDFPRPFLDTLTYDAKLLLKIHHVDKLGVSAEGFENRWKAETGSEIPVSRTARQRAKKKLELALQHFLAGNTLSLGGGYHRLICPPVDVSGSSRHPAVIESLSGEHKLLIKLYEVDGLDHTGALKRWSQFDYIGSSPNAELLKHRYKALVKLIGPPNNPSPRSLVSRNLPTRLDELHYSEEALNSLDAIDKLALQIKEIEGPEKDWKWAEMGEQWLKRTGVKSKAKPGETLRSRLAGTVYRNIDLITQARQADDSNQQTPNPQGEGRVKIGRQLQRVTEPVQTIDDDIYDLPFHDQATLFKLAKESRARILTEHALESKKGQHVDPPSFTRRFDYSQFTSRDFLSGTSTKNRLRMASQTHSHFRNLHEIHDARRGIDPSPQSYDDLSGHEARQLARSNGFSVSSRKTSKRDMIAMVESVKVTVGQPMTLEDAQAVAKVLAQNLVDSLAARLPVKSIRNSARNLQSPNRGLRAPDGVFQRLEEAVARNLFPHYTSNAGLLCGPRALFMSLWTIQRMQWDEAGRQGSLPRYFSPEDVLRIMFDNTSRADMAATPASVVPNQPGVPSAAYAEFLRRRLTDFGYTEGEENWDIEWRELTTLNNFNSVQLQFMLDFMHEQNLLDQEYILGIVAGDTAEILDSDESSNAHIIWLYNDNLAAEQDGLLGHWEGFEVNGSREDLVTSWGLRTPQGGGASQSRKAPRFKNGKTNSARHKSSLLTEDQIQAAESNRVRDLQNHRASRLRKQCLSCRSDPKVRDCDGEAGKRACTRCLENGAECIFPQGTPGASGSEDLEAGVAAEGVGSDGADEGFEDDEDGEFDFSNSPDVEASDQSESDSEDVPGIDELIFSGVDLLQTEPTDPDEPYFLVFSCARFSSHREAAHLPTLLAAATATAHRYGTMLYGSHLAAPEGTLPGGPGTVMSWHPVLLQQHGSRGVPTTLNANHPNPYLTNFVRQIRHVTRPGNQINRPVRIQFLTLGLAGFAVDITAFGSRTRGFFHFMLQQDLANQTALADRIDLVSVVEPIVVDGLSPACLTGVGGPSPYWQAHTNKYVLTNRLVDLIDRHYLRESWPALNAAQQAAGLPPSPLPMTPMDRRLDHHLDALTEEYIWRLPAGTPAQRTNTAGRNHGRNTPWQ